MFRTLEQSGFEIVDNFFISALLLTNYLFCVVVGYFKAQGCPEARVASTLGKKALATVAKSDVTGESYNTFYEGFKIGKKIATQRSRENDKKILI